MTKVLNGFTLLSCLAAILCWHPAAAISGTGKVAESITIVVTDSGLGGLSVAADLERRLRESGAFAEVELVFFNALFSPDGGYNSLPSRESKILMLDRALTALQHRYRPDVVLIACNTLSVLYQDTRFAAEAPTPVIDIVQGGVELIAACLADDPDGRVLVFGTETTIEEGAHLSALAARGFELDRVVTQSCPQLAAYIEQDVDGPATGMLIEAYVAEAMAASVGGSAGIYVSFNCTHFGYAMDAWRLAFITQGITVAGYIDPNGTMADAVLDMGEPGHYPEAKVRVSAVSMIEIPEATIASIGNCLERISPATKEALIRYELHPDLFQWQDLFSSEHLR